ncbi:MAG: hypothetical protein FWG80_02955 [Alphaproteobacteria bacterium]|nr:hypothetical protein [Alphaproteobacteria bacterium]
MSLRSDVILVWCHCESRRQADEAIFFKMGSIRIPLSGKIASSVTASGDATRNDTECLKRLLRGLRPLAMTRNVIMAYINNGFPPKTGTTATALPL